MTLCVSIHLYAYGYVHTYVGVRTKWREGGWGQKEKVGGMKLERGRETENESEREGKLEGIEKV